MHELLKHRMIVMYCRGGFTLTQRTFASEFAGRGKASREGIGRDTLFVGRVSIHSRR